MLECRDSDAISASRKRPGMRYVRERSADSICDTEDEFFRMKVRYLSRYSFGKEMVCSRVDVAAFCDGAGLGLDGSCLCAMSAWPSSLTDKGGVGGYPTLLGPIPNHS
jgi:hypothetical protein